MIEVTSNHLAQLLEPIFHYVRIRLRTHAGECIRSPGRSLGLHQNAVAVTVIQNPLVLRPVDTRKNAVQVLHVLMVVGNPLRRLSHAELWIAPSHPFHAHQSHVLAIEVECTISNVELPHAEISGEAMLVEPIRYGKIKAVQIGMVEM